VSFESLTESAYLKPLRMRFTAVDKIWNKFVQFYEKITLEIKETNLGYVDYTRLCRCATLSYDEKSVRIRSTV
jgi:hypothetical protein